MRIPSRNHHALDAGRGRFEGLFLHGAATFGDIMGDLDGTSYEVGGVGSNQFFILPDIDPTAGMGFLLGMRFVEWEVLFGWSRTDYDARGFGLDMTTRVTYLDLLFRHYFLGHFDSLTSFPIQPYVVGGFGLSSAEIKNGSVDLTAMTLSDGKLNDGITYSLGAGLSLHLTNWLALYWQGIGRLGEHESASGSFGSGQIQKNIDTDGWEISGGVSLRLFRGRSGD